MSDSPHSDTIEVEIDLSELDLSETVSETATRDEPARAPLEEHARDEAARTPRPEIERGEAAFTPPALQQTQTQAPQPAQPAAPQPAQLPASQPAQPTSPRPARSAQESPAQSHATHALPSPFGGMVERVNDSRLRALVASTFARILKSLESLKAVEGALTLQKVLSVGSLFDAVREQATSLLAHLTETVVHDEHLDEEFREVLDGIRFVVAHEMGKVFSYEFPGLTSEGPSKFTRAELTRAWGLLQNCLQQTAVTLARVVEPDATGQQLFEDYRRKTENSLTLFREMQALLQKVKMAEKANGILLKHSLVRHLEHFREETMHFLMYKDWGEFGRFVDEVKRAFEEMEDFDCVLHGFAQYLSTLIHHVGMREVLNARPGPSTNATRAAVPSGPTAPETRRA